MPVLGGVAATSPYAVVPLGWGSRWRTARATAGSSLVTVAAVGDSLTAGQQASNLRTKTWVGLTRIALQNAYGNGGDGFVSTNLNNKSQSAYGNSFTESWQLGSIGLWTQPFSAFNGGGPGSSNGLYTGTSGQTATITVRGTNVRFFYGSFGTDEATNGGTFTLTLDGGTPVALTGQRSDGTTGRKVSTHTFTGLTDTTHTLVYTCTQASKFTGVLGASGFNASGVVVNNYGKPGGSSPVAVTLGSAQDFESPHLWNAGPSMPCSLGLYAFGVNNVHAGSLVNTRASVGAMQRWADTVLDATDGQTDLVFIAPHVGLWDAGFNAAVTDQEGYGNLANAIEATARSYGAAYINLWAAGRNSWDWMNTQGYWGNLSTPGVAGTDTVHLSDAGHAWWANHVTPVLLS